MARDSSPTQNAPTRVIEWAAVCALLEKAFDRALLTYHPNNDDRRAAILNLMKIASAVREYAIASKEDLIPLWDELRRSNQTIDLFMEVTSDMLLRSGYTLQELASSYADAVHASIPRGAANGKAVIYMETVADDGFMDSVANRDDFFKILQVNPWVLAFLLLKRHGKFSVFRQAESTGGE